MAVRQGYTPSIQELSALVACANHGTASAAAEALGLTQSAISRSIRTLEDKLGTRLFDRVRQRLHLTDAGRLLAQDAERILAQLDASARTLLAFSGTSQVLRIAVLPSFGTTWFVPKLVRFQTRHPDISVDVSAELNAIDFASAPFDCAIQRTELRGAGTRSVPLMQESLVAVAAPALIGRMKRLENMPLLQQSTRPRLWQDWFEQSDLEMSDMLRGPRFEHFEMIIAAAKAGMGAALVPEVLISGELEEGKLQRLTDEAQVQASSYALIYPEENEDHKAVTALRDWLLQEI